MISIKKIFLFLSSILLFLFLCSDLLSKEIKEIESFLNLKKLYLSDHTHTHNSKIKIISLNEVEEAHEVPVIIKLPENLANAYKIAILIDNNPIQLAANIFPYKNIKSIGVNVRLEQDSLVRVAVLDESNIWHVNSKKIIVNSPGGCSLPSCNPEKEICEMKELGKIKLNKYQRSSGNWRFKLSINHPMDTGLVKNPTSGDFIPEYFINHISLENRNGYTLAKADTFGALSANPILIIDFIENLNVTSVTASDSKGKVFKLNTK